MEEAATPFPSEETTPPVTKIYFGAILAVREFQARTYRPSAGDVQGIMDATSKSVNWQRAEKANQWYGIHEIEECERRGQPTAR